MKKVRMKLPLCQCIIAAYGKHLSSKKAVQKMEVDFIRGHCQ